MISLSEYSKSKFNPNNDQMKALLALEEFFESDISCFLLKGYAGTGKTHLVKYISEYLELKKLKTVLLAPTGRASRILEKKTGHKSSTIHKGIYNLDQVDEIEISKDGKKKYKFRFNLQFIESNTRSIYLIDESSMISDKYSEDDFFIFGSGRLLKDLLTYLAPTNKGRSDQVIFIGDPAQLPPVTDNISGALDSGYLFNNFNIKTSEYELTEVFRQHKESGILANATNLRNLLQNKHRNSFEINTSFDDITSIDIKNVVETFIGINSELSPSKLVIVNYSNKSALEFNLL
ncbi:MAG: AAA family ATPase, partial [Bacteroidetes bacterium]|nr:AAA family ATPase [Bacteroidota bacterium]